MKYPLISIITVCYNSEKTIQNTIESVLNQSYQNYEYIIIDGSSTDRTLGIINEYKSKFNGRMRWISEKDDGLYYAMNKGINIAKGDLIGIINSDDWYNSKALEMIVNNYEKDIDIYYGDIYSFRKIENHFYTRRINGNKLNLIKNGMTIPHPSCFVNKKWYSKLKFDTRYRIGADYKFILESFINGANFKYIYFPFSFMRIGGASSTQTVLSIKESMYVRSEILGERNSILEYMLKILIVKLYRLRNNIAFALLPKSIIKKIRERRGWEAYKD